MDNKIFYNLYETKFNYCHALEVNDVYELQNFIESLVNEFVHVYSDQDIIEFFETIELYCLNDENENEVYNFDILNYVNELLN